MTIANARNSMQIEAPAVATGGFLAVADVIDNPDPHSLLGADYESDACISGDLWYDFCTTAVGFTGVKNFTDSPNLVTGTPFVVYSGVECNMNSVDESTERAIARLKFSERRLVDEEIYTRLAAQDVVSGVAGAKVENAIAALEALAASSYGGRPTLVIPVEAVTLACAKQVIHRVNGELVTCQDSVVANVAVARADPATLYVVGKVTLIRGPIMTFEAPGMSSVKSATITNKALTGNVATLTTSVAHTFVVGQTVTVSGVGAPFDGTFVITAVTATTFSYGATAADVVSVAATGTATTNVANPHRALAERIYVPLIECIAISATADLTPA